MIRHRRRGAPLRTCSILIAAVVVSGAFPLGSASADVRRDLQRGPIAAAGVELLASAEGNGRRRHVRLLGDRPGHPARTERGATKPPKQASASGSAEASAAGLIAPGTGASSVSAWSFGAEGSSADNPSIAASPTRVMTASVDNITWRDLDGAGWLLNGETTPWDLFALPLDEYYTRPTIAYSVRTGRWLGVLPTLEDESSNCSTGYLDVAISTTTDPAKPWLRVRVNIGSAFADSAWLGLSDDKLVITTNEWNLALVDGGCIGTAYEGSRIRVVDLADLIDGGAATVRDLGVGPGYFNWYPVTAAPPPGSTSSGSSVDLVAEAFANGGWQNVVFARVTGSARAGTQALGGLADLTLAGTVPALAAPPAVQSIVGAQWFDERMVAVAGRPGRVWFAANAPCTPAGDDTVRVCARFVELDTTTSLPTVRQDGVYGTSGHDTFLPSVGMSKDGKVFLRMTRALPVFVTPLDQYVVQLAADQAMEGGPVPVRFFAGTDGLHSDNYAFLSTFALDPSTQHGVLNIGPAGYEFVELAQRIARFRGGLTADPTGSAIVNNGRAWNSGYRAEIVASPLASSPIVTMRVSAQGATETTAGGERLVQAVDLPPGPMGYVDLHLAALGGTTGEGRHAAWIQFGTGDGRWQAPVEHGFQVDVTPPIITKGPTSGFATGYTVGTTAAVRTSWDGSDVPSGLATWQLNRILVGGTHYSASLPGTTESVVHALGFGKTYRYDVQPRDLAGNPSPEQATGSSARPLAYQGTTSAIVYTTGFSTSTSTSYLGGSTRYATLAGKKATFTFTGRSVALVSTKARTRGKFEVYLNGVKKATIDLYSSTAKHRQIVWAMNVPYGTHKVAIRVLGTSGRPRVDIDAFLRL